MAEKPVWMPLYVADYLADTGRLSCEQHGAYLLIIMDYWRNGPPPDNDETLAQICKLDRAKWRKARPAIEQFFTRENGIWRHKRIDQELNRADDITEKRRAAGKSGAKRRWGSKDDSNCYADDMANASQTHSKPNGKSIDNHNHNHNHSHKVEEEGVDKEPLLHRALAFSGRTIRLNQRDFEEWQRRYSAIPDLAAELGALDDWLRNAPQAKRDNWFQVVSGSLARKHQQAIAAAKRSDEGDDLEGFVC